MNVFDAINRWINSVEGSVVNLISAIAPWFAPLAPAYMAYQGMDGETLGVYFTPKFDVYVDKCQ